MAYNHGNNDCKVYVGNLPQDIKKSDLEDVFYKYGKLIEVDLHNARGPGAPFAFVEFEDPRDADDAVRGRDGYAYNGYRIRVEFPRSSARGGGGGGRRGSDRDRGYRGGGGGYVGGKGGGYSRGKPKGYQLIVSCLPPTGSWQDLKDHFREAGDVIYTEVYKDCTGSVEFSRYDHMKRALRDLDDSKFRSHEGETSFIRVKEPRDPRRGSRSPSPRRSRSPHYARSDSPYNRRSGSPHYRRSYSKSRSRSRSH